MLLNTTKNRVKTAKDDGTFEFFINLPSQKWRQEGRVEQVNPMQGMFDFFSGGSAYKKARFADPLTPRVLLILMKYGIMDHSEMDGINIGIIPSSSLESWLLFENLFKRMWDGRVVICVRWWMNFGISLCFGRLEPSWAMVGL